MAERVQSGISAPSEADLVSTLTPRPEAAPVLSVVIPALNEERGIDAILQRVLAQREELERAGVGQLEVIVVDDGSRDATAERVSAHPDVRLIRHPGNQGYG
ncbi:MAG TPA: glycosyltransferase, partial [Chloroflexota bacterium]|nr:glycosyltransferase [Chloroflexota bacterium]